MKEIALLAPTASGKTNLSIQLAHKTNSIILSFDSLAVYKDINIASAKPTIKERDGIKHFGIDVVLPNEHFDVSHFINIYQQAKQYAQANNQNLIIVGGTGFYLKALVSGISMMPTYEESTYKWVDDMMMDLQYSYNFMYDIDNTYMDKIASNDPYRIKKALMIYKQTAQIPSQYFKINQPVPLSNNINIYEIVWDKEELRSRIGLRTKKMLNDGLIDEVVYLKNKYGTKIKSMKSIGIKETLDYIDNKISIYQLEELITIHTAQLAKQQRTFNKGQFKTTHKFSLNDMKQYFNIVSD